MMVFEIIAKILFLPVIFIVVLSKGTIYLLDGINTLLDDFIDTLMEF